jgi:riboflavin kinase/FMN adenylyltransferase
MTDSIQTGHPFTVVHGATPAPALKGAVVAIGNFDGVHRGHRAVIAAALARAQTLGRPAAALTFEPHPRSFLRPQEPVFRITDEAAKLRLFAATGLNGAIVLKFDAALAEPSPEDFVDAILVRRLGIAGAAVGYDFRFGRNRAGTPDLLAAEGARHGFAVDIVPAVEVEGLRIASGAVREALAAGHIKEANTFLGYPTANLQLDPSCGLRHGIYAVRVGIGGRRYNGVASFGRRPMFDVGTVLLEVFLFDFSGDLYGQTIDVAFIDWIRHELNLGSVEALIRRMDEDSRIARLELGRAPDVFPPLGEVLP